MFKLRRARYTLILLALVCAAALLDVFTGWRILSIPIVSVGMGAAAASILLGARQLRLLLAILVLTCLGLHLGFSILIGYEATHWDRLQPQRARQALLQVTESLEAKFSVVLGQCQELAADAELARSLRSGTRTETFSTLERLGASSRSDAEKQGIGLVGWDGNLVAWTGKLPNWPGRAYADTLVPGVRLQRSTTHHWIEATVPMEMGEGRSGWVLVFRQLDAIYPGILPEAGLPTLSEELTRQVGHEVRIHWGQEYQSDGDTLVGSETPSRIGLPGGSTVGYVTVSGRAFEDEQASLTGKGLFVASALVLLLIVAGTVGLSRRLVGTRFERASPLNLALLLAMLGGARLGFSRLRDFLRLGDLESFTSYHYATHIPTGILRSPADLMITSLLLGLGLSFLVLARMRRQAQAPVARTSGYETLPFAAAGIAVGAVSAGIILVADRILRRVLADSGLSLFTLSPFHTQPSYVVMRIGLLALTVALILLGAVLIGWQISLLRRHWGGGGSPRVPLLLSAVVVYALTVGFVALGAGRLLLLTATMIVASALVLDQVVRRKIVVGLIGLALGLALAASALEFAYSVEDYAHKRQEAIESAATQVMARTDAWKTSVLEEALSRVSRNREVADRLADQQADLDALALKLWANSILSRANVVSGIYLLDAQHLEVGRFSLQEVGELADLDAALREARFVGQPLTTVARGTFGGEEVELYVGVAPFFRDDTYLGSVVITIPHAYRDVEAMVGLSPTFFEAIGGAARWPHLPEEEYSVSLLSGGKIISSTAGGFEVGKRVLELEGMEPNQPAWIRHKVGGVTQASYFVPYGDGSEALLMSFRLPSWSDRVIRFMGLAVGNLIIAFAVIVVGSLARAVRHFMRRRRGMARIRLRWSFASQLALAFVLIAIIPTLILGTASGRFLRARLREIMESRAAESLALSRLALDRLVLEEALRLARNPILFDALRAEPSLLGQLVTQDLKALHYDVSSAVIDSRGDTLASYGHPRIPGEVLDAVLSQGRSYGFFAIDGGLTAKAAVAVRDEIDPDRIIGCAFVSRRIDDGLARQISSELGRDLNFYGQNTVAASSRRELFISELMPSIISPDAFVGCFLQGQELHFVWESIGNIEVVVGHTPLRGFGGATVGTISVPVVFRKDEVGKRMEWTSAAISYLLVIVICAIFVFGLVLAKRISRPIQELIRGTLRIGSGDLSFTIPKTRDDEIGDLVSSFNQMTAALAKSRKALSERKKYIETIIGNVGAGIISTNARGRIDTFNSAAEMLLGTRARNARGRDARRLLRRMGAGDLASVLDEVHGERIVVRKEVSLTPRNGPAITLRAVATAVAGPRGRSMGKVIVFEDVTELIRSKKLIAWSEMARQVAHEIKNPLTPMKLSAQHLLRAHQDGAADFDQVLADSVATIVEQIESLRRIAVEFAQFSRMPERKLEETSINGVLEESLAQYERTIGTTIEITKNLDRGLPKLLLDRDEIRRVFLNIIENAIQAMPQGGKLELRSARLRPARQRSDYEIAVSSRIGGPEDLGEVVEVSFTDTGQGISRQNSQQLFEPNFSTKSHGTGLGLAICKGIIDAYGGEIAIESTAGVGTKVRVRLPAPGRPTWRGRPRRRGSESRRRPGWE